MIENQNINEERRLVSLLMKERTVNFMHNINRGC